MSDDAWLDEIKEFFVIEGVDLLESVESSFLELEKNPEDEDTINSIFRFVHNIKGSSKSVGLTNLAEFTHHLENVLSKIRSKDIVASKEIVSLLLRSVDKISDSLSALQQDLNNDIDHSDMIKEIEKVLSLELAGSGHASKGSEDKGLTFHNQQAPAKSVGEILVEEKKVTYEDVESAAKLQESKIGEILVEQGKVDEQDVQAALQKQVVSGKKSVDEHIRISLGKIDELVNYFGEQVILQSTLEYAKSDVVNNQELIQKTITQLSKITYDLQQTAISLRMVSIKNLFSKLERTVRDSSTALEKKIVFHKEGSENELDKIILESILDPLNHMIRNSVDHGIENSDDRVMKGKSEEGHVWLRAYPKGGFFYIEIEDDGKGLDKEKILAKAIEKGISVSPKASDAEVFSLIFRSGLSTKDQTTEFSGRGVGMDVVKTSIEKLKGVITIESTLDVGTKFLIRLPQSLAIFKGMVVEVAGDKYVVANSDVIEVVPYIETKAREVGRNKMMDIKGDVVEIINLSEHLKTGPSTIDENNIEPTVVIVNYNNKKYGLKVDRLLAQQRVVHKKVGSEIKKVKGITGGAILGDGQVALIVSPSAILSNVVQ